MTYTLPFTSDQLNRLFDYSTNSYFDIGFQVITPDGPRPFKDPLEAVLAMSRFDLELLLARLSRSVYFAHSQDLPYTHLEKVFQEYLESVRQREAWDFDLNWQCYTKTPDQFKNWHLTIEIHRRGQIDKTLIHIKGRDLEAIEKQP